MNSYLQLVLKSGENIVLEEKNVPMKKIEDNLSFQIEGMTHIINIKEETFLRENDEYSFLLDIKNKKSTITLKKEQYVLQVEVEYAILLKNQNEINISYLIETDDNIYNLILSLEEDRK